MEIQRDAKELMTKLVSRKDAIQRELVSIESMIAALELAEEFGNGVHLDSKPTKRRRKVKTKKAAARNSARPTAAKGDMRKSVIEAFSHYDGQPLTCEQLTRYIEKHKPKSLKRRHTNGMRSRVSSELTRMSTDGLIKCVGKGGSMGNAKVWQFVGKK